MTLLSALADANQRELWTWQVNTGLQTPAGPIAGTQSASDMLLHLIGGEAAPLVLMKDLHHHFDPIVIRSLRDLYYRWRDSGGVAVLSATFRVIPQDLEREMAFLRLDLPSQEEMIREVERWQNDMAMDLPVSAMVASATLKGLTLAEARHGLNRLRGQTLDDLQTLRLLREEKKQLVQKTGTLEYIPNVPELEGLGGLENLRGGVVTLRASQG